MTANFQNRTLWTGDNLDIMRGMNSSSVDLIYLDPPLLCSECNRKKGAQSMYEFKQKRRSELLREIAELEA